MLRVFCFLAQERKVQRKSESKKDWLSGVYMPVARIAVEEGNGVLGWASVLISDAVRSFLLLHGMTQ